MTFKIEEWQWVESLNQNITFKHERQFNYTGINKEGMGNLVSGLAFSHSSHGLF